jgi:hypothetical protein
MPLLMPHGLVAMSSSTVMSQSLSMPSQVSADGVHGGGMSTLATMPAPLAPGSAGVLPLGVGVVPLGVGVVPLEGGVVPATPAVGSAPLELMDGFTGALLMAAVPAAAVTPVPAVATTPAVALAVVFGLAAPATPTTGALPAAVVDPTAGVPSLTAPVLEDCESDRRTQTSSLSVVPMGQPPPQPTSVSWYALEIRAQSNQQRRMRRTRSDMFDLQRTYVSSLVMTSARGPHVLA